MFTNLLAWAVYSVIGSEEAQKHWFVAMLQWTFNRQQALIDLGVGAAMCAAAVAVVVFIGTKINKAHNANVNA